MAKMEHQIRQALQLLAENETINRAEFSEAKIGDKTITTLLEERWAILGSSPSGIALYSITDAGRARAKEPRQAPAPKRKPLKMLKPAMPILDFRTVKPRSK